MSVSADDFHQLASQLAAGSTEIEWRNAAARAYYAAFHKAQEIMDLCPDLSHLSMGSHTIVSERLLKHGHVKAKSLAYILQSMKRVRHIADYEISDGFEKSTCDSQIAQYPVFKERVVAFDASQRQKTA